MRPFLDPASMLLSVLTWSSVAYAALTDAVISTRAAATDISPGVVNLDLIFPLNNTYAPFDGAMPVVFALSRPDIGSVLQLKVSYLLADQANLGIVFGNDQVFDLTSEPTPSTKNNGDGEYAFFVHFSNDSIAGRVGQFRVEITFTYVVDYPGDEKVPNTIVQAPLIYDMFFTTQTGAQRGIVPGMEISSSNSTNNASTCISLGRESFYVPINITGFVTENDTNYGVISTDKGPNSLPGCAVEVDADTAATIAAGPTTATATGSSATSSATGSSTANSGTSGPVLNTFATVSVTTVVLCFAFFGGAFLL